MIALVVHVTMKKIGSSKKSLQYRRVHQIAAEKLRHTLSVVSSLSSLLKTRHEAAMVSKEYDQSFSK